RRRPDIQFVYFHFEPRSFQKELIWFSAETQWVTTDNYSRYVITSVGQRNIKRSIVLTKEMRFAFIREK
ncbi:MAG: hypothetical protein CBE16_07670, partial [Rhodospirillaceae bacterium TMED256]